MHVLFLTENFPPEVNASATRVYERAVYWVRAGHEVTVVTCFPNFPQGRLYDGWRQKLWSSELMDGIRVIRLPTYIARNEGFFRRTLDFVSYMAAVVVATPWLPKVDVVAATSPQFFAAVAGWIVSVLKRRPFVFELGDLWPASIRAVGAMRDSAILDVLEKLELFLYRKAVAVVALTEPFKKDLVRRGIDAAKIAVVMNGVDLPRYSPRSKDEAILLRHGLNDKFVVGYIGTHGMAQDLGNILMAVEMLSDCPNLRVMLVGDGAEKSKLVGLAQERRISNIVFVDPQPKDQMPSYWSACDVALVHLKDDPVFAEVIPSKMFEAMAMGLPLLLVAPVGEASGIVTREGVGLAVRAGRPDDLADAMRRLFMSPELRTDLATAAVAAAPRYTRLRQAELMMEVLERSAKRLPPVES